MSPSLPCDRCHNVGCSFGCMKTQYDLTQDELELVMSELAEIKRRRDEYKFKLETLAEEFKLEQARREHLQAILARIHSPAQDVWYWQGRDDDVQTLSCPVVMSADTLRKLRTEAINDAAEWISSSMASMLFGSDSWSLRKRIAEVVKSRDWETHLKNEVMR